MTDDPRKWVQVADYLRRQIDAGQLEPDTRVSIPKLARERGVSKETVTRAVHALTDEGRLRRFPGHGYIVVRQCPSCQHQYGSDAHKKACETTTPVSATFATGD